MGRIVVLTTGGTIAMTEDPQTRSMKPTQSQQLQQLLPLLKRHADVQMETFLNIPSPHMTLEHMHRLSQKIKQLVDQPEIDGVVVTHGTDTLEETAYFLELSLSERKPVILTGAMRGADEPGADGPVNLVHAVRVAVHPDADGKGVLVVFNEKIHMARFVTKTDTHNVAAFQSPQNGPIGIITNDSIVFFHQPTMNRKTFEPDTMSARIALITAVAGTDGLLLQAALDAGVDGIVLEGLGQGNLPPPMAHVVNKACQRGIPVVMTSRCLQGFVDGTYGYEGGGKQLEQMGVIFTNGLNGPKARIKLILALATIRDRKNLKTIFSKNWL